MDRLIEPLGLVAKGSVWYLVAVAEGEPRNYRVSRIRSAELTEERSTGRIHLIWPDIGKCQPRRFWNGCQCGIFG